MSLKTDDVVRGVLDLARTAQELEQVKKEHYELSQQVGQLQRNIEILKKANKEEQDAFDKFKKEKDKYIEDIKGQISILENNRASLSSSVAPELKKLETLKSQIEGLRNSAENRNKEVEDKFILHSKNQSILEEKKNILKQIKELADKL